MLDQKLGFIGLGEMGRPMVKNLLNAGYSVTVWNRSQPGIDECVGYGAVAGTSPRDVAEKSDVVITMVIGSEDVREVVLGPNGVIEGTHPGMIVIDMTTISPKFSKEVADRLRQKGVKMLDAPVSGYDVGAKTGTLAIMVGGPVDAFQKCCPIFDVLGENIVHMGAENGAGHATKLCNQVLCGLSFLATCEAFTLARKSNLDMEKVLSVVRTGVAASPLLDRYGVRILEGDSTVAGMSRKTDLLKKDLGLIVEAAKDVGTSLPGTTLVEQLYSRTGTKELPEIGVVGLILSLERWEQAK